MGEEHTENVNDAVEAKLKEVRQKINGTPLLYSVAHGGEHLVTTVDQLASDFPTNLARMAFGGKTPLESIITEYEGVNVIDFTETELTSDNEAIANMPIPTHDKEKIGTVSEESNTKRVSVPDFLDYWRRNAESGVKIGAVRDGKIVWENDEAA